MFNRKTYIVFLSFSLFSCSAPGVKPQDANLLEAAVNLSSGEFEGQLSRDQLKLQESREILNTQSNENQRLNTELESLVLQKQSLDSQLINLQTENLRLEQLANQTKAKTAIQQIERDKQQAKVRALNSSINKLKNKNVSQEGNKEYESKVLSLQQEIGLLRQMIINQ